MEEERKERVYREMLKGKPHEDLCASNGCQSLFAVCRLYTLLFSQMNPFVASSINCSILSSGVSAPFMPLMSVLSSVFISLFIPSSSLKDHRRDCRASFVSREYYRFSFHSSVSLSPDIHIRFLHIVCVCVHMHVQYVPKRQSRLLERSNSR